MAPPSLMHFSPVYVIAEAMMAFVLDLSQSRLEYEVHILQVSKYIVSDYPFNLGWSGWG